MLEEYGEIIRKEGVQMALQYYETIVILSSDLTEKEYNAYKDKYIRMVLDSTEGATIKDLDLMGMKKLAYPIREKYTEGWYIMFTYITLPEKVLEFERNFRIDDNVLKFLTVKREEEDAELDEYAEVPDDRIDEIAKSPAEINVESEQAARTPDSWDLVFDL